MTAQLRETSNRGRFIVRLPSLAIYDQIATSVGEAA